MKFNFLIKSDGNDLKVIVNGKSLSKICCFYIKNDFGRFSWKIIKSRKLFNSLKAKDYKSGYLFFEFLDNRLTVLPDEWGRVPVFFNYNKKRGELFCSLEFKKIIKNCNLEIDNAEILKQLFFGYSFFGKTIFKDTFILSPYKKIIFTRNGLRLEYNHLKLENTTDSKEIGIGFIDKKINSVFNDYYKSPLKKLFSISGGLDSRLLLAKFMEIKGYKPHCFTYGTKNDRDVIIAKNITKDLGLKHKVFEIKPASFIKNAEEYLLFCGGTNSITNSRAFDIYKNFKNDEIIINGFGGDLTFGGGVHKKKLLKYKSDKFLLEFLFKKFCKIDLEDFCKMFKISKSNLRKIIKSDITDLKKNIGGQGSLALKTDKILLLSKVLYFGYWSVLFSARKAKVITPLFDTRLNYFFLSINSRVRYKHSLYKKYFLDKYPELAKYHWQKFGANLYGEIDPVLISDRVNRRIPYQKFFAKELRSWINQVVFSKDSYVKNLVDVNILKKVVNCKKGDNNWADFIGQLISIELLIKIVKARQYGTQ